MKEKLKKFLGANYDSVKYYIYRNLGRLCSMVSYHLHMQANKFYKKSLNIVEVKNENR